MSNFVKRPNRTHFNPMNVLGDVFGDDIFDGFFVQPTRNKQGLVTDVMTNDEGYQISMAVPGVPKEQINVDLANNTLTVSYETKSENKNTLSTGSFKKTWSLPDGVDAELITATAKDGILTVGIPTTGQGNTTRNITIK